MQNINLTRRLVYYGLAIALVTITTMAVSIPNPFHGYTNLGDTMIYTLALLGGPALAMTAGGLGSAMADMLLGYTQWIIPSLMVKGLEGLIAGVLTGQTAGKLKNRNVLIRTVFGLLTAGLWMVTGYYITARILYGTPAALANIPSDLVQAGVNIPLGLLLAWVISKTGIKLLK